MQSEPTSLLTRERPDLWQRVHALATATTGMLYLPKLPAADGTIWACGGGGPSRPRTLEEQIEDAKHYIENWKRSRLRWPEDDEFRIGQERAEELLRELERRKEIESKAVCVPDGAVEWLLHEVGHWVAATPAERLLPNYGVTGSEYGHDGEREWQAWGFEELVLAPFGPSRLFAPPSQRDGAVFKVGPMPAFATRHAEQRVRELGIDVQQWRALYGEWVRWGLTKTVRPWDRVN